MTYGQPPVCRRSGCGQTASDEPAGCEGDIGYCPAHRQEIRAVRARLTNRSQRARAGAHDIERGTAVNGLESVLDRIWSRLASVEEAIRNSKQEVLEAVSNVQKTIDTDVAALTQVLSDFACDDEPSDHPRGPGAIRRRSPPGRVDAGVIRSLARGDS